MHTISFFRALLSTSPKEEIISYSCAISHITVKVTLLSKYLKIYFLNQLLILSDGILFEHKNVLLHFGLFHMRDFCFRSFFSLGSAVCGAASEHQSKPSKTLNQM